MRFALDYRKSNLFFLKSIGVGALLFFLASCSPQTSSPVVLTPVVESEITQATVTKEVKVTPTSTLSPSPTTQSLPDFTATPDTRLTPKYWREWEIVPNLSQSSIEILEQGLLLGNNPQSFSRVGDCQSEPPVFLGVYATDRWRLPDEYHDISDSVEYYKDAFDIYNVTAEKGFGVSSVLSPLFSDPEVCLPAETPLDCELRLRQPIIVFIAMGTNWQPESSASFERYLRQIVDILIEKGSLPVLMNKPDNIEGDGMLNLAIAQVAYDYDLPMINVWKALDYLPAHGLQEDGVYMIPEAWNERNLYALVVLDNVRQSIMSFDN